MSRRYAVKFTGGHHPGTFLRRVGPNVSRSAMFRRNVREATSWVKYSTAARHAGRVGGIVVDAATGEAAVDES